MTDHDHYRTKLEKLGQMYLVSARAAPRFTSSVDEGMIYQVIYKTRGVVTLANLRVPYHGRYGPDVIAKRRQSGKYWYVSNEAADMISEDVAEQMEGLGEDNDTTLKPFDLDLLGELRF